MPVVAKKKLEEHTEEETVSDINIDHLRSAVCNLQDKAKRLKLLAAPLRKSCSETAELAQQCVEAAGEI